MVSDGIGGLYSLSNAPDSHIHERAAMTDPRVIVPADYRKAGPAKVPGSVLQMISAHLNTAGLPGFGRLINGTVTRYGMYSIRQRRKSYLA